jgi:uncharacterized protein with von Willebrand factor type A (vWA) domain
MATLPTDMPDAAAIAAALGAALREAGITAGTGRCARFARAIIVLQARSIADLRSAALATLISDPAQLDTFDRVFAAMFAPGQPAPLPRPVVTQVATTSADGDGPHDTAPPVKVVASAVERLRGRDFAALTPQELRRLVAMMRELTVAVPERTTRRYAPSRSGQRADLRRTLRQARRTGGEPVWLATRAARKKPRRLVVLCDISGSMQPYARALLQLVYCAARGPVRARTEVFTFATRLTRLTTALAAASAETMLDRAGESAPDWASGTRIGACLREFNDKFGARGLARGAVVLVISDGWETGDPALVGTQMARLSRLAHKIVWANPRTKSELYRPEVGGMAAAWPYCDCVVSAHSLDALDDLLDALGTR